MQASNILIYEGHQCLYGFSRRRTEKLAPVGFSVSAIDVRPTFCQHDWCFAIACKSKGQHSSVPSQFDLLKLVFGFQAGLRTLAWTHKRRVCSFLGVSRCQGRKNPVEKTKGLYSSGRNIRNMLTSIQIVSNSNAEVIYRLSLFQNLTVQCIFMFEYAGKPGLI